MNWTRTLMAPLAAIAPLSLLSVLSSGNPDAGPTFVPPRVVRWSHGDPVLRLLPAERGICFVSGIGGNFQGGGEAVRIYVDDGWWWVGGRTCQPSLWVEVTCVEWPDSQLGAASAGQRRGP